VPEMCVRGDFLGNRMAAEDRHDEVENNEVRECIVEATQSLQPVACLCHLESGHRERGAVHAPQVGVIIHDEQSAPRHGRGVLQERCATFREHDTTPRPFVGTGTPRACACRMGLRPHVPARRRARRGYPHGEPRRQELVAIILGTYREMPGVSLTSEQAARFFALRFTTCEVVLRDLASAGHLRRTVDGRYLLK
jgi:hypothetical protein